MTYGLWTIKRPSAAVTDARVTKDLIWQLWSIANRIKLEVVVIVVKDGLPALPPLYLLRENNRESLASWSMCPAKLWRLRVVLVNFLQTSAHFTRLCKAIPVSPYL
jgi:hypothetical protein